jgi:hypothetical protein
MTGVNPTALITSQTADRSVGGRLIGAKPENVETAGSG